MSVIIDGIIAAYYFDIEVLFVIRSGVLVIVSSETAECVEINMSAALWLSESVVYVFADRKDA